MRVERPSRVPFVRPRSIGDGNEVGLRRAPLGSQLGTRERLNARRQIRVAQHDRDRAKRLGEAARGHNRMEAFLNCRRRNDDARRVARLREQRREQIGLFDFGRKAGAGTAALDVDHDERRFGHDCESDELGLERESGP